MLDVRASGRTLGLLTLLASGCGGEGLPPIVEYGMFDGRAFGTRWSVRASAMVDGADPEAAIADVLASVDASMSTWREDSEISRARAATGPVEVSEQTAWVVRSALDLADASRGAFDPTVQPLMELWGFHGRARASMPTEAEIAAAREKVDWRRVKLTRAETGPLLDTGGTSLDLSAIAKGYAVDRLVHALSRLGAGNLFVEVGGEVRVVGLNPAGERWRVGVDLPAATESPGTLSVVLHVTNAAVATSGNYRNTVTLDGEAFGHTMDPRLGRPVVGSSASVTVVAPDCMTADGLATTLMVMDVDQGRAFVERLPDVDAAWLAPAGAGFTLHVSSGLVVGRDIEIVSDRVVSAADVKGDK